MSGPAALPYFGDAYMADTRHLTLEEHGAYHLLILIAWRSPHCALPNDDKRLAQMLGITPKKWASIRPQVMAFWTLTKNGFEQKRLTKERRWVEEKSKHNRAAAKQRWNAKSLENNDADDANACANADADADANGYAPPPPPTKNSSVSKDTSQRAWKIPDGVPDEVWADFLKNRKTKRMPNTDTAWKKFNDDLARVGAATGLPPPKLIEQCTAKGWGGIYDPRENGNGQSSQQRNGPGNQPVDGLSTTTRAALRVFGAGQ